MKIFILPTSYPNDSNPQKNIFIYEQAKQLAKMGHEIVVLHVEKMPTRKIFSRIDRNIKKYDDGFAVRYSLQQKTFLDKQLPYFNKNKFIDDMKLLYEYVVKIHGKPDVLYAHFSQWAGYAGGIISEMYDVPLVTLEHYSSWLSNNISRSMIKSVEFTVDKSDYFLCVSKPLKESILKNTKIFKEIFVVSNMIDSSFNYYPHIDHDGFVFSAIGRLTFQKNYPLLVNAFIKTFSPEEDVFLRIAGDGEDYSKLNEIIKNNGRENQIKLLGRISREQTLDEYKMCDCFALASNYETFGLVYREALAVGRPIITTDHGGFSEEDWHDEYGLMVSKNDIDQFSSALKYIYNHYSEYDGKKISELCLNDCSADMIGRKIENYLLKAINNRRG